MMVVRIENHIHTHLSIVMCIQTKSVASGMLEMIAMRLGAMITIIAIGNTIAQSVITETTAREVQDGFQDYYSVLSFLCLFRCLL